MGEIMPYAKGGRQAVRLQEIMLNETLEKMWRNDYFWGSMTVLSAVISDDSKDSIPHSCLSYLSV